jgi:hypothetical protein
MKTPVQTAVSVHHLGSRALRPVLALGVLVLPVTPPSFARPAATARRRIVVGLKLGTTTS